MPKASPRSIATSADGSTTLWVPALDEHYHSIHGALTESKHVFIDAGFKALSKSEIRILEVGLGTALNARLTLEAAVGTSVHYVALEKFPLNSEEIAAISEAGMAAEGQFLKVPPMTPTLLGDAFTFELKTTDLREFTAPQDSFDLIYFDAFAPSAQPELWTDAIFQNMFNILSPGGALVTYCAKGSVKRSMKTAGFEVEALPGPPRKREMTRAWKR